MSDFKDTWKKIMVYFPDIWQYIVIIVVITLGAIFILFEN